jgi:F-type H+-transporting ATPase subunit b
MRKLLCGIAVAVLALVASATVAGAQEEEHADDAVPAIVEEIHHAGEAGEVDTVVAECAILALENNDADRCQESPNLILPAKNELLWGGLSFLVLLLALWKFGIPAATKMSNERTEKIRKSLDDAETAKNESETVLAEYQRQLADARAESSRIVEEARVQAEQVAKDIKAKAEAEAAELRQRTAEQVGGERDRVLGEMQGQVASLAIELAEKVVESNLDRETNTRLIESYIASVGARS